MYPKDTYPSHMPTCMATMNHDIVTVVSPIPPSARGSER